MQTIRTSAYMGAIVRALAVLFVAAAALVAFAACGGGDDGNDKPKATQPSGGESPTDEPDGQTPGDVTSCDLVSKEEAADILGEPVDDADTGAAACVYSASSIDSFASVGVSLLSLENEDAANTVFDEGKAQVDAPEDISGLGDEAYWDPSFGSVDIRQDEHFVSISVAFADGDSTTDEGKQAALDLAETAVGRLP